MRFSGVDSWKTSRTGRAIGAASAAGAAVQGLDHKTTPC